MGRVFSDLYTFLVIFLPWKAVVGALAVLGVAMVPFWMETVREKQLRGQVRRMVRAESSVRAELVEQAFTLAGERSSRLARLVESGRQYAQIDVVERALERIAAKDPKEADRLRTLGQPRARVPDAMEVAIRVESLLANDLPDRAREVLADGLRDHPADAELLALRDRLA